MRHFSGFSYAKPGSLLTIGVDTDLWCLVSVEHLH